MQPNKTFPGDHQYNANFNTEMTQHWFFWFLYISSTKIFYSTCQIEKIRMGHGPFPHKLQSSTKSDAFIQSCSFYPWSLLKTFLRASPTMRFFFGWLAALCALKYACNQWSRTICRSWQHSKIAAFDFYCKRYKKPCECAHYYFLRIIYSLFTTVIVWWDCNITSLLHVNIILYCFFISTSGLYEYMLLVCLYLSWLRFS
jgi:hypothetical protein